MFRDISISNIEILMAFAMIFWCKGWAGVLSRKPKSANTKKFPRGSVP